MHLTLMYQAEAALAMHLLEALCLGFGLGASRVNSNRPRQWSDHTSLCGQAAHQGFHAQHSRAVFGVQMLGLYSHNHGAAGPKRVQPAKESLWLGQVLPPQPGRKPTPARSGIVRWLVHLVTQAAIFCDAS